MADRICYRIQIGLKAYLESIGVTPYILGKWVRNVSSQTIYAVTNGTRRPSLEVLEAILTELNARGYPTELSDIVQMVRVEEGPY